MQKMSVWYNTNLTAPHPSLKQMRVLIKQPILPGVATRLQTIGATGLTMIDRVQILKDPETWAVSKKENTFYIHTKVEDGTDSIDHLTSGTIIVITPNSDERRQTCHWPLGSSHYIAGVWCIMNVWPWNVLYFASFVSKLDHRAFQEIRCCLHKMITLIATIWSQSVAIKIKQP